MAVMYPATGPLQGKPDGVSASHGVQGPVQSRGCGASSLAATAVKFNACTQTAQPMVVMHPATTPLQGTPDGISASHGVQTSIQSHGCAACSLAATAVEFSAGVQTALRALSSGCDASSERAQARKA